MRMNLHDFEALFVQCQALVGTLDLKVYGYEL
jgi:hypothetical protein